MTPPPLLDFLQTLPVFIEKSPPVVGFSQNRLVNVVLQLDRRLTDIFIDPLLVSHREIRANVLSAIYSAQDLRNRQVQAIISQHSCIAKLNLWDVEGTLLAIKCQQSTGAIDFQGIGQNRSISVVRNYRGEIIRLILNSSGKCDRQDLERLIMEAAQQGYEKVRSLQESLAFPDLIII